MRPCERKNENRRCLPQGCGYSKDDKAGLGLVIMPGLLRQMEREDSGIRIKRHLDIGNYREVF